MSTSSFYQLCRSSFDIASQKFFDFVVGRFLTWIKIPASWLPGQKLHEDDQDQLWLQPMCVWLCRDNIRSKHCVAAASGQHNVSWILDWKYPSIRSFDVSVEKMTSPASVSEFKNAFLRSEPILKLSMLKVGFNSICCAYERIRHRVLLAL